MGKVVMVKSRLTDKLQNYFGIALRSNIGDLKKNARSYFSKFISYCIIRK